LFINRKFIIYFINVLYTIVKKRGTQKKLSCLIATLIHILKLHQLFFLNTLFNFYFKNLFIVKKHTLLPVNSMSHHTKRTTQQLTLKKCIFWKLDQKLIIK